MRKHGVPEELIGSISPVYQDAKSYVRYIIGITKEFSIKIGVHQGLVLYPSLFITVMDTQSPPDKFVWDSVELHVEVYNARHPKGLLCADDMFLEMSAREELEELQKYGLRLNVRRPSARNFLPKFSEC